VFVRGVTYQCNRHSCVKNAPCDVRSL